MPTETIESKEIYRGFIALQLVTLRLADGERVSHEIIEHGKAAAVLPVTPATAPSCSCLPMSVFQYPKCGRDYSDYNC
jgi:hypothetical protein